MKVDIEQCYGVGLSDLGTANMITRSPMPMPDGMTNVVRAALCVPNSLTRAALSGMCRLRLNRAFIVQ